MSTDPKPLHKDLYWSFTANAFSIDHIKSLLFKLNALDLGNSKNQELMIKAIIACRVSKNTSISQINAAHEYLKNTPGMFNHFMQHLLVKHSDQVKTCHFEITTELIDYPLLVAIIFLGRGHKNM